MLFNSKLFVLIFLPITLTAFLLAARLPDKRAPRMVLAISSLAFYTYARPPFLILLITSIATNYALSKAISRTRLIAGISFNLALLAYFKYRGLFAALAGFPNLPVILPVGISFFTFQQIMFLTDTYRRQIPQNSNFLDYLTFVSFFPHLIAGPIVRPRDIIPQFQTLNPLQNCPKRLQNGAEIFLLGLTKKIVLADSFAQLADPGFAAAAHHPITFIEAWVALLAYSLQIYFDFSGYSDMAIGLAAMFGIKFPPNFNSPYQAKNIQDFWRRWNITLSLFLRDYLYIPLGGNRKGPMHQYANLMATMLLGGLWHGAALKFLLWGGLHGLYLIIHKQAARLPVTIHPLIIKLATLTAVIIAWVPFRATNFQATQTMFAALAARNGIAIPTIIATFIPVPSFIHVVPILPYLGDARTFSLPLAIAMLATGWAIVLTQPNLQSASPFRKSLATIASFAFTIQALILAPSAIPFLYFQF